ncbi:MAG TPA: hypothetical protein VHG31_09045 [Stellaceae bacterium]|nr:hypothetical protein [Stellaceae bacterium]
MIVIKTRINVAKDGMLSGSADGLPQGEHDAEIVLPGGRRTLSERDCWNLLARVRAIQAELAAIPVLDDRRPDEIIGYNERGHFDQW